ncbi:lytic transglycosylase domain-containing protein [Gemmobacter lutimaris]|uniref:Lytic transglycosylase domain-containing protein n=1 Tax=Gemmobacter lutimaris TaxID=2306023 RepID=A0A398BN08_9RHOB|nr:lytic transglycosylase domain-containing protein [Gemmobacter lutimaris]
MCGVACGASQADVIRWNEPEGQGTEIEFASLEASVLRYDGQGKLIVPARPDTEEQVREGAGATTEVSYSSKGIAAPAEVLPAIRLVAARYQDHPALAKIDLSPREWAAFFQAMIKVESNYSQRAVSSAGAIGLAQLMPGTARSLGVDAGQPIENLDGGARYLLEQLAAFGRLDLALAAYNAGPEAVRKHDGIPPYRETRTHVRRVFATYDRILAET